MAGLNDGYRPASSNDKSHGVWHNWLGDNGADAWVQYDWEYRSDDISVRRILFYRW